MTKPKKHRRADAAGEAAETVAEAVRESRPEAEPERPTNGNGHGGATAKASVPPPEPAAAPHRDRAGELLAAAGRRLGELVRARGFAATATGVVLVLLAVWLGTGSALSVPAMILGIVLVLVGVLGRRLRGHVSIEWGPAGASLDLRAEVAPPGRTRVPEAPSRAHAALPPQLDEAVVESTGETIEMDVGALRALLAAREARGDETAR